MPVRNLISHLRNIRAIITTKRFEQGRREYFSIYKEQYPRYSNLIEPQAPSSMPIDVIIPVVEKDLLALPHVINGVRTHVKHPLVQIYIVAPASESIGAVAKATGCIFINETTVCATTKQQINFVVNGKDRSGWIYQQLLKLNFDKLGTCENYLVVDADTVFIKDTAFERKGKLYFDFSDEYNEAYYKSYELITGMKHNSRVSFIAHYMLFTKARLKELKQKIEQHSNKGYTDAIIQLKEKVFNNSNFSEYETYANYCITMYPHAYRIRYWFNNSLRNSELKDINTAAALHKGKHKSISFHAYKVE